MLIFNLAKKCLREVSEGRRFKIVIITCFKHSNECEERPNEPAFENRRFCLLLTYFCKFCSGLTQNQPVVGRIVRQNCA
jgi:hypothetical protein